MLDQYAKLIQKRIYMIAFLIIFLFFYLCQGISIEFSNIMLETKAAILTSSVAYGDLNKLEVKGGFIFRLSTNGRLAIWSAIQGTLLYQIFYGYNQYSTQTCLGFDLASDNQTLAAYTQSNNVYLLSINQSGVLKNISFFVPHYNITGSSVHAFSDIKFGFDEIILFSNLKNQASLQRFSLNGSSIEQIKLSANIAPIFNMKTCQLTSQNSSEVYYLTVWKDDCFFQVYQCFVGGSCSIFSSKKSNFCSNSDFRSNLTTNFQLQYSKDCSLLIVSSRTMGYSVFDIYQQTFLASFSSTIGLDVTGLAYIQSIGFTLLAGFTVNGVFFANECMPTVQQNVINMAVNEYGFKSVFSIQNEFFLTANNSHILFYGFYCQNSSLTLVNGGMCLSCPQYCTVCSLNVLCSQCLTNYTLIQSNNTCILSSLIVTPQPPNNNNTNTNITSQKQTKTPTYKQNITVQPKYQFQSDLNNIISSDSTSSVINASVFSLGMLQLFPFSFLFIRFINFWSICSFYLFLGIKMPIYLYNLLYGIYEGINTSIFQSLGINFTPYLTQDQKVSQWMKSEFGVSWDFVSQNFENFILLFASYLILLGLYVLKLYLDKNNILRKGLQKIRFPLAAIGQYVAMMNSFFLVLPVIQKQSYQDAFSQKINISLHLIFIIISLLIIGFAMSYVNDCQCHHKIQGNSHQFGEENYSQLLREWTINCLCNSILPALAAFGIPILYLVFNGGFFAYMLYSGTKVKQFRLNSIILALQLVIFHLAFIALTIFDSQNTPLIFHMSSICLVGIIFLGALHQFLSFIMSILHGLYRAIKAHLSSVANQQSIDDIIEKGDKIDFSHQSSTIKLKKPNVLGDKKDLTNLLSPKLQIQSISQLNIKPSQKSIFKEHFQWKKKHAKFENKKKKSVKFNIDSINQKQISNHFHFKKALSSKESSQNNSPQQKNQQINVSKTIKQKHRKPNVTAKYKTIKQPKGLKVEDINRNNHEDSNIFKFQEQHEKSQSPIPIISKKNISLYQIRSMKQIKNLKQSIQSSNSQHNKNSVNMPAKSIKSTFNIQMVDLNQNQSPQG